MTREEIGLVQESFNRLRPIPRGVGRAFYETLFTLDPSLKSLFKGDLDAQGAMFVSALGLAVAGIDDAHAGERPLRDLGARHAPYGLTEAHYATFREALVRTLRDQLGASFTDAHAAAWRAAFDRIGLVMRDAASGA
ncbi:MAG TPA: globin domain-containing protein [Thermoanaerobaculia bacterium]|nr:globin domain-containing protein [Thermoanaerobaculia bacterium]